MNLGNAIINRLQHSETDLILAAQGGSVVAFEQLIVRSQSKMLSLAAGLAATPDEAEDIYQDAMLSAFKALAGFNRQSQFSTWLYRILINTALSRRRKIKHVFISLFSSSDDEFSQVAQYNLTEGPEAELHNQELNRAIHRALGSLSDKERVAFVLCHQQEFKISEAAKVMICSDGAVKSYLFRGREKMRVQLTEYLR